jgi:hypothetical protein
MISVSVIAVLCAYADPHPVTSVADKVSDTQIAETHPRER